jgi:hypothetical protein
MGLVLPTRMRPFVTSDLFSPLDKLRMGLDLVLPRDGLAQDIAVGTFLRRRLGDALVERLAGPLIGGVYGTPVDELSLLAVVPQLRDADRDHRSLLLASLGYLVYTLAYEPGTVLEPGPGFVPRGMAALWVVLCGALVLREGRARPQGEGPAGGLRAELRPLALAAAVLFYLVAAERS